MDQPAFGGTLMLMPQWRNVLLFSCLFAAVAALGAGLARVAAKSATEAPAGFNTPSFNSAQSISNGIVEPPGDTFARDQQVYEQNKKQSRMALSHQCLQRHQLR